MKAIVPHTYGSLDVLALQEVGTLEPRDGEVQHAAPEYAYVPAARRQPKQGCAPGKTVFAM
jgi:hypothetical protein